MALQSCLSKVRHGLLTIIILREWSSSCYFFLGTFHIYSCHLLSYNASLPFMRTTPFKSSYQLFL
jgi:hypothetical protein